MYRKLTIVSGIVTLLIALAYGTLSLVTGAMTIVFGALWLSEISRNPNQPGP
jgi:hypothetical protein